MMFISEEGLKNHEQRQETNLASDVILLCRLFLDEGSD